MIPRSGTSGILWPAVPEPAAACLLAVQHQLSQSQWLPPADLERRQFQALGRMLEHARGTVPFYRDGAAYAGAPHGRAPTRADWADLPILTRADVQDAGDTLVSVDIPADHLPLREVFTSGSTGRPLRSVGTLVTHVFWLAITLRDHKWHGRDLTGTLAAIRPDRSGTVPPTGRVDNGWGPATDLVFETGPCAVLGVEQDVPVQADWLTGQDPDYLLSLPSNLLALAQHFLATGRTLPRLREVRSYGEVLGSGVRPACEEAWGAKVVDMYSTQELGYVALQCPLHDSYHVQAETVYVEVVDEDGRACGPGETGRVVVSALHNFAMPLFRYEVGDYAEVGDVCPCGRGLPVLNRIMGRQRNMLTLPTGRRFWPTFGAAWRDTDVIRQFQLVQREPDHIEARIVGPRPMTAEEEGRFRDNLAARLGYPFKVSFLYLDRIERDRSLKFEDFVSLVPER
ncbi:MAG: phenylacetate--CoA ligase family protein [Acidimicrobiales bacterium]